MTEDKPDLVVEPKNPLDLDKKRGGKPYIWVSWITGLLAGTDRCYWRAWWKAHRKYAKIEQGPEREAFLKEWTEKHDAMVQARAEVLKSQGYLLKVEDDGAFTLEGRTAVLSGKPDIVAIPPDSQLESIVFDQKSGKVRTSDKWQVRLYMFALPLTWFKGKLKGVVEYRDGLHDVKPLTDADRGHIAATISTVGADVEPERVPSVAECKYCDIRYCPDRVTATAGHTDSF